MNNNNRGNNNRRRGRGNNNNRQGGGGGQPINRIDSRARGNAPQMLEKYRKLAHDAHLNGDRVQEEYYLQFADHYFRVIADTRTRQEEARQRRDDRWQEGSEGERDESDEASEFSNDDGYANYDPPTGSAPRREREDRGEFRRPQRQERDERGPREDRAPREERVQAEEPPVAEAQPDESEASDRNPFEPAENPFLRENRGTRGLRPRREDRRPRRDERSDEVAPAGLDPSMLPPSISAARDEAPADDGHDAPKPRRGRPRKKPYADDAGGETLESVG